MPRLSRRTAATVVAAVLASIGCAVPVSAAPAQQSRTVHHANLVSAIDNLPDYFPGVVKWHLSTSWKHYGTTDWNTNTITISAFTPLSLLYSVVAHEWSHEVQAYDYHGELWVGVKAMNQHFGGAGKSGQRGIEYAADCMAILQGATWTHYTPCRHKSWRRDARRLLDGHRLKALPSDKTTKTTSTSSPGSVTYGNPPQPDR